MSERQHDKNEIANDQIRNDKNQMKLIEDSANDGNIDSMCMMGKLFHYANSGNEGWYENAKIAFGWFKKAANQGHLESQYKLGFMTAYGHGVKSNLKEAIKWYIKSAEGGYSEAQFALGDKYFDEEDYINAVKWIEKAGDQGHYDAQRKMVRIYKKGLGVEVDYGEVQKWDELVNENEEYDAYDCH